MLSQTWGEVNKAGGEDCITDNGTENMEFVGHMENQLSNCANTTPSTESLNSGI